MNPPGRRLSTPAGDEGAAPQQKVPFDLLHRQDAIMQERGKQGCRGAPLFQGLGDVIDAAGSP